MSWLLVVGALLVGVPVVASLGFFAFIICLGFRDAAKQRAREEREWRVLVADLNEVDRIAAEWARQ